MRYLGGKARIGKQIAEVIQQFNPVHYHEPMAGMYSVGKYIQCQKRTAGDINLDLILLLQAIQQGWIPPDVSEAQYIALRSDISSPLRGFAGFGCSFYGKFFGGYARDKQGSNYAAISRRSLMKLAPMIQGVEFRWEKYQYNGADVIYCDPPYLGTTNYSCGGFDHDQFWEWVRATSLGAVVLVSEYEAPPDFTVIWEKSVTTSMRGKEGNFRRVEKLFRLI
jgi:DNA adenine methylase